MAMHSNQPFGRTLGAIAILILLLCYQLAGCRQQVSTAPSLVQDEVAIATPSPNTDSVVDNPQTLADRWVVSAHEADQMIEKGATVLDARGGLFTVRLPGATAVDWRAFSPTERAIRGTLLSDDSALGEKIRALGVSNDRPVVVFGNPLRGWGEEGRIVWMLRSLGHSQAVMVDGGIRAIKESGISIPSSTPVIGDFEVDRRSTWSIQRDELKDRLQTESIALIDSRELREFSGSTPYGEQRGGHVPGAVHLYFKDLLDADGRLLPKQEIVRKLAALGITSEERIVVYCTGGIRSGWLTAVLVSIGFQSQNYAGSMWEWSASPAANYPLES